MPHTDTDHAPDAMATDSGAVLIGLQLSPRALDNLVALGWLRETDRANRHAVLDAVVAVLLKAGAVGLRPGAATWLSLEEPREPAPEGISAPGIVCFHAAASPAMQRDLVALGFLADSDRGNSDAVMKAALQLTAEGASLFKDLDRFFVSLREAKRRLDTQGDGGRQGALHALDAVLRYLMLFQRTYTESLLPPLALLFGDLFSLDGGEVGPMVAPVKKRGGALASGFYNALKGIAVFIVERLEASGLAPLEARKAVAKELSKLGVRPARKGSREGSGEFGARTIKKWQEDIAADIGFKTTAAQEFRACQIGNERKVLEVCGLARLPEGSTADDLELGHVGSAEFRRRYLNSLAQIVLDTRLGRRKST